MIKNGIPLYENDSDIAIQKTKSMFSLCSRSLNIVTDEQSADENDTGKIFKLN